ncbi:mechanosensitive ion channel domain-containing protein [Paraglaciecola arctica]|uniref:Potassium efflux system protein KefA n=1 Tax=Paraglaciecola arctica BSs20135 TaxID=493475 RepID=K6YSV0_9ALTE|nr:mechanosensitive ion channel domain-containing protein [Paraglaciecola arctica]GAC21252.1 potassium efflux system protein KefA [Paraglaciecola arctica BSs20135]
MQERSRYSLVNLGFVVLMCICLCQLVPQAIAQQSNLENGINQFSERLEQNTDLSEEQKKQGLTNLKDAENMLAIAKEQRNLADSYEQQATTASQRIIEIQKKTQQVGKKSVRIDKSLSAEKLENQLLLAISAQNSQLSALGKKQNQQTDLSLRANDIAKQLSVARTDQTTIDDALANQSDANLSLIDQTNYLKKQAASEKISATINMLEREISTIPARQSLVDAELILLSVQTEFGEKLIIELQSFLAQSRSNQIQKTVKQSSETLNQLEQQPVLASIARENLSFANLLERMQQSSSQNEVDMGALRRQLLEVKHSSETVERVLATGRVTDELGELLRKLRAGLPSKSMIEQRKATIEEDVVRQQLDVILWQERLRDMVDIPATAERFLIEKDPNIKNQPVELDNVDEPRFSPQKLEKAQQLVESRRVLLADLIEVSNSQSDRIIEEKLIINQLLTASSDLRELLERRLIWLPSNSGRAGNLAINLRESVEWYASPRAWWTLLNDMFKGAKAAPILPLILLIFPLLILALRSVIKRSLWTLIDRIGKVDQDTYFTTPLALIYTFILALPLPICLFTIAGMIFKGSQPASFSIAIAAGLASVSTLSLALLFFRSMCRKGGVFEEHFGWSDLAREKLRKMLTWFVWLQSITTFIFASAIASGNTELRYGIAIIAFIVASIGIALFSYLFFQPKNGVATSIVGETPASPITLLLFPIVVLALLAIGLLPLFGFFDTAVELQSKLFLSGILLVFAAVVYGIMLRVFLVTFRRYMVKKAKVEAIQAKEKQNQTSMEASGEAGPEKFEEKRIDEKEVMRQSRSIMLWVTALLFLAGLWLVWKPLLPALGIVDDIVLWQQVKVVDGVELSSGVTLWNIILSLGFVIGGVIAAKNIRGVMEIGFFERFEMDYGARYATMSILGYLLVGTGIVIGFSQLGIDWSKLQWIIAALGVGLGFGLQEIVANFVSGLIILFERPIRVGDFVTIGNLSGTVSNIKIRATTIKDFDNREVLLPNKSIITENVTNWTLHDSVTRIVVKIGVAYGSDIQQVRDLLMQVVENKSDVLQQPAPQVFFLEHGDSSLNFEIRAFVSRPENRLPLTHAINTTINQALAEHDISIPFPQRDLHIISNHPSDGAAILKAEIKEDDGQGSQREDNQDK